MNTEPGSAPGQTASAPPAPAFSLRSGAPGRGHLVIIGGGERPLVVMRRIVDLAGGASARIVVVPTASDAPLEVGALQAQEFLALGVAEAGVLSCRRQDADHPQNLALLARATGVFFSGGDQRKLTATFLGTRMLDAIRALYERGGVVAGTSAGAAVMSRIMITGDEHPIGAEPAASPTSRHIHTAPGFGFIDRAIIDQHFLKRSRQYRLRSLVARHPELLGIGIDEATAIVVAPDDTFTTLGDSHVLVFDAPRIPTPTTDVRIETLVAGQSYCLNRQRTLC